MRRNLVSFLYVVLIAMLLSQATGCSVIKGIFRDFLGIKSETRVGEPREEPPEVSKPRPPGAFNLRLKIRNWNVEDHKILDYDIRWGSFRHAGRFVYLDKLVFKFKSDRYPDHYWLTKIPEVKEGNYEIRAIRYEEPSTGLDPD